MKIKAGNIYANREILTLADEFEADTIVYALEDADSSYFNAMVIKVRSLKLDESSLFSDGGFEWKLCKSSYLYNEYRLKHPYYVCNAKTIWQDLEDRLATL